LLPRQLELPDGSYRSTGRGRASKMGCAQDREKADSNLIDIGYNLLFEERFELACRVLDFSTTTLRTFSSEQKRLTLLINQAQAYKWSGDMETTRSILSNEDWSTRSDAFQLAEAVLLDDFDKADEIVKRVGTTSNLKKSNLSEWPLFREYRKSQEFQSTFEEVFQEPLNLFNIKSPETDSITEDEPLPEDEQFLTDERPPVGELLPEEEQF